MKKFFAILLTVCMLLPLFAMLPIGAAEPPTEGYQFSKRDYVDGVRQGTDDNESWYFADNKLSDVPYTIEAWFKVDNDHPKTVDAGTIVGTSNGWSNYAWWRLDIVTYTQDGTAKLIPYFTWNEQYNNATSQRTFNFYTTEVVPGEWMHFAVVIDAQNSKVYAYANSELIRTVDVDIHLATLSENVNKLPLMVGNDGRCGPLPSDNVFDGKISSVSLFSDARTAAEITQDYQNGAPYTDTNAIAHWEFSPTGGAVLDKTGNGNSLSESKYWLSEAEMDALRLENGMVNADGSVNYAYSFAAVGDIQYIIQKDIANGMTYENYTDAYVTKLHQKLASMVEDKKIQYVMSMGDITQTDTDAEWHLAYEAIRNTLKGTVDYSVIRGNHDFYSGDDGSTGLDLENGGVGINTYWANDSTYMAQFDGTKGGLYEEGSVANAWYTKTIEGTDWLFLNLDFGPDDDVVAWANGVLYDHPEHQVIITTHCYLHMDGTTCDDEDTGSTDEAVQNNGDELWNELVSRHPNIKMVLSGHQESNNIMFTQSKGASDADGNFTTVSQFLIDQQDVDAKYMASGQDPLGLVAMLYVSTEGKVWVEWYSTLHDKYYQTRNQFSFELDNPNCEEQDTSWSGLSIAPVGAGTETNPYIIQSAGNLMWMSEQVYATHQTTLADGATAAFEGVYFKQVCDIDLGGLLIKSIGFYHTSQNDVEKVTAFAGTYDGGGYKIKNGAIIPYNYQNNLSTKVSHGFNINWCDGLFGCIYGATIKNVTLDELDIYSYGVTGGLVGRAVAPNDGSAESDFNVISNCHLTSSCTINAWFDKGCSVQPEEEERFEFYDTRYNAGAVGSVCGMAYATTIRGCSSAVDLTVDGYHGLVGGIVGTAGYNSVVEYCKFTGSITLTDNKNITDITTNKLVPFTVGGIVGLAAPNKKTDTMWDYDNFEGGLQILNCYNAGTFSYTGDGTLAQELHVGGILGHARYLHDLSYRDDCAYLIKGCYNLAELTAPTTTDGTWLGGIVGKATGTAYGQEGTLWIEDSASVTVSASGGVGTNEYRITTDRPTAHGTAFVAPVMKDDVSTVTTKAATDMTDAIAAIELGMTVVQNDKNDIGGNKWLTGAGAPTDEANNGDMYLDSATGNVYQYADGWQLVMNIKGQDGKDANKWFFGEVAPTTVNGAASGDMYMNTEDGKIYSFDGSAWTEIGCLKGEKGDDGDDATINGVITINSDGYWCIGGESTGVSALGQKGEDGNTWTVGEGAPSGTANVGDMYYDKTACEVYQYQESGWIKIGSIKGADGEDGEDGEDGNKWYTGEGAPATTLVGMIEGDLYLDLSNGDVYKYTTVWSKIGNIKGATGDKGVQGTPGTDGSNGTDGADGNTWTVGEGAPSATANVGDMYYDKTGCKVYQYQSTGWTEIGSIKGDQGEQGEQGVQGTPGTDGTNGTDGADGNKWYTGTTDTPDVSDPNAGDMYMNTTNGNVFRYDGTAWVSAGNLTGPQGDTGAQGEKGDTGATGAQGEKGEKGDTGAQGPQGEKGEDGADAASSDSANASGGADADSAAVSSSEGGNGLAVAAIVIAVVIGGANAALVAVLLLKKKKAA